MRRNWTAHTFPVGMTNTYSLSGKTVWCFLEKTKQALTIQTSNCFPVRLFQRNENLCSPKILYVNVHSSLICNTWKLTQSSCPAMDEWLNTRGCIHTIEYHSAIKGNELLIEQLGWVSRELCGVKRTNLKKLHPVWFHLYNNFKITKMENDLLVARSGWWVSDE